MTRDPIVNPHAGDRFRLRSGVDVTLVAAGLGGMVTHLRDSDGFRHPVKNAGHLAEMLRGAEYLGFVDGLTALLEGR